MNAPRGERNSKTITKDINDALWNTKDVAALIIGFLNIDDICVLARVYMLFKHVTESALERIQFVNVRPEWRQHKHFSVLRVVSELRFLKQACTNLVPPE